MHRQYYFFKFWILVMSVVVGSFFQATPVSAAPPDDFQITQIIGSGLDGPSAFELAPDGRIFFLERTGLIKVYKNGALLPEPFADLPSVASGDRGLIGIAFDPDFLTNHYVYFYYTGTDQLNRLVRFNAEGDVGTDGPFILYQTSFPSEWLHVGGSIRFGSDGKLYFAVGDNGNPPLAQQLDNPHGKILRINKDGSIPGDNPFVGTAGALGEIWAYGMRNPWRFQFDSATDRLYGGDVGNFTWEEINLIEKGKNYGWPLHEGMCVDNCDGFTDPIYTYNHNDESAAVTGGPIYRNTLFPEEYQGALFFSDYAQGFIKYMKLNAAGGNAGVFDFDTNAGSVVDMKVAADGSMYYITYFPGRLYRITYATDNHIPIASASSDVTKGADPLTVQFSSAGSSDPDDDPLTFHWDFGDDTESTEANPEKIYTEKGTYTVQLTVSDGPNVAQAVPLVIIVGTPPDLTIALPNEGDTFRAGDHIRYQVGALDGAGNDIDDGDIVTDVLLHHDAHIHPFQDDLIGRTNEFVIPATGEAASHIWYEIRVTATDTDNLSTTKSVNIFPLTSDMTFATEPAGLDITLEGSPSPTPHIVTGVVGFQRQIGTPTLQEQNGLIYQFDHWSDSGAQTHTILTPESDTTYTAVFHETTPFAGEYFSNPNLTGPPTLTRSDNTIDFDWGDASPAPELPTSNFSVRWTKSTTLNAGTYEFTATADDGIRLYIDGVLSIDKWINQNATTYTITKVLVSGEHEIKVEYYDSSGAAVAKVNYVKIAEPIAWQGKYWNTPGLGSEPALPTTAPDLARGDTDLNFDWGDGAPGAGIDIDHFVAQWTKIDTFEGGSYRFTTTADDGIRVYLDSELILDQWIDQAPTTYTIDVPVTAGDHTVKVEYYENGGGAVAKVNYSKIVSPPPGSYAGEYFDNPTLTGTPILLRSESLIDFDWGVGSPDASLPVDNFSARWTKTENFAAGSYQFTVTGDDGVRLLIDGIVVLDKWIDQAPTTYQVTQALTTGDHTIVFEYYENGGGAVAQLSYAQVAAQSAWQGKYWNTPGAGSTPPVPTTVPTLTRADNVIDFDWAGGSPASPITVDHFVAQWTKTDTFEESTYRFTTISDDGIRFFLDGELVIDQWNDHAPTTHTADRVVTAGSHTLKVEYYENGGGAVAKFNSLKITGPPPTSWNAQYFDNITLSGASVLTRNDATIDFDWAGGSPGAPVPVDNFSARWTKTENFAFGRYQFTVTGDDGVRVLIDGNLVLDRWIDQAPTTYQITRDLTAGDHTIVLEYYEKGGGAVAKLQYSSL